MVFELVLISLTLLAATIFTHYETLRLTSLFLARIKAHPRGALIIVLVATLMSHLAHVFFYALAYYGLERAGMGFGMVGGGENLGFDEAFYFSITSYTTLGIGDLHPTGSLRMLAGVEALNGLVMVGWTASFTYISMERFWRLGDNENGNDPKKSG